LVMRTVQAFMSAVSEHQQGDCTMHAKLLAALLHDEGVSAKAVAGFAAWRVGDAPHAVVAHHPDGELAQAPDKDSAVFHAWVECAGRILDSTIYTLARKVQAMDAFDGLHTPVTWQRPYLYVPKTSCASLSAVRDGHLAGMYYYQRRPEFEHRCLDYRLDDGDLEHARMVREVLRSAPQAKILGPHTQQFG